MVSSWGPTSILRTSDLCIKSMTANFAEMLGLCGYRAHAIALTQSNRVVQRLYESLRVRFGLTAHDVGFGFRELLRHNSNHP
jgi:hypothetical protein